MGRFSYALSDMCLPLKVEVLSVMRACGTHYVIYKKSDDCAQTCNKKLNHELSVLEGAGEEGDKVYR
jgi:hypothetical protein